MKVTKKKLLSFLMMGALTLSTANLASASETNDFPDQDSVPTGYSIINQYPINESSEVNGPLKLDSNVEQQDSLKTQSLTNESATDSNYIPELTSDKTYMYRELKNESNGESMKQYVTDAKVAAVPGNKDQSDVQKDDKSDITVTIRMFYHSKNKGGNTYYGLDKIYYRYEGTPDRSKISTVTGRVNQQGPGINDNAQLQSSKIQPQYGLALGKTVLVDLKSKGWVEVLDGGLLTQVGIELLAGISNSGIVHEFRAPFFITGQF